MNSKLTALIIILLYIGNASAESSNKLFSEKGFRTGPEAIASSSFLIIVGLLFIFTGKRLIKFLSFIAGFIFFGAVTILISSRFIDLINGRDDHRNWILGSTLIIAIIGGILSYRILKLGVMFLAFLMGYSIGGIILQCSQSLSFWAQLGIMLGFGGVAFVIAFFFIDWTILIATSYIGTQALLIGIDVIVNRDYIHFIKANSDLRFIKITPYIGGMLGCAFVLTIIGALLQYKVYPKQNYYEIENQINYNNEV